MKPLFVGQETMKWSCEVSKKVPFFDCVTFATSISINSILFPLPIFATYVCMTPHAPILHIKRNSCLWAPNSTKNTTFGFKGLEHEQAHLKVQKV